MKRADRTEELLLFPSPVLASMHTSAEWVTKSWPRPRTVAVNKSRLFLDHFILSLTLSGVAIATDLLPP